MQGYAEVDVAERAKFNICLIAGGQQRVTIVTEIPDSTLELVENISTFQRQHGNTELWVKTCCLATSRPLKEWSPRQHLTNRPPAALTQYTATRTKSGA